MALKTKRVYDPPEKTDGRRILIDGLWPRGLTKEKAQIDEWLKEIAPSNALRKWFGHKRERWNEFQQRYREELGDPQRIEQLHHLRTLMRKGSVTLLFASRDSEYSNVKVLSDVLKRQ